MDLTLTPDGAGVPRRGCGRGSRPTIPGREPEGDEAGFEFRRAWQRKLNERGWAGLSWPEEYGGAGATLVEQAIFNEEIARAGAPRIANVLGLAMGGPTVIAHGTDAQKERYLAPILSAEEIWCQGFSEPESGSDLASVKHARPCATATSGSSPARRCGRRSRTRPSGACSSRAPTPRRPSTAA